MKNQYAGDVNDFRKYLLLRRLTSDTDLRLGVCWMLTPDDGGNDGKKTTYLSNRARYRKSDPELFDSLAKLLEERSEAIGLGDDSLIQAIEHSRVLGEASFQREFLADADVERRFLYFQNCLERMAGCDIVFFDPDNGLEIRSKPKKENKNSNKYLFFDEVSALLEDEKSLLIYQHRPRIETVRYMTERVAQLRERCPRCPGPITVFQAGAVLFFLLANPKHQQILEERVQAARNDLGQADIRISVL